WAGITATPPCWAAHWPAACFYTGSSSGSSGCDGAGLCAGRAGIRIGGRRRRAGHCGSVVMNEPFGLAEWIIDQVSDALIYADREGNIRRWNPAATALFGFSAEEALGQNLDLIIPEHLRE